jgi:hypothetical protein
VPKVDFFRNNPTGVEGDNEYYRSRLNVLQSKSHVSDEKAIRLKNGQNHFA